MKKQIRLPHPKIVPPPDERVDMQFEVTKDKLRLLEEEPRELGCWSLDEFVRIARAEFLQGYFD